MRARAARTVAWQQHIITLVKEYELGKPKQHPVGMTALFPNGNDADLFASTADSISPAAPGNDLGYAERRRVRR